MSGKGSKRRPMKVDKKTFEANWNRIFNKEKVKNGANTHTGQARNS